MGTKKKERKLKKLFRRENSRYGLDWERRWNKQIEETNRKDKQDQTEKPKQE